MQESWEGGWGVTVPGKKGGPGPPLVAGVVKSQPPWDSKLIYPVSINVPMSPGVPFLLKAREKSKGSQRDPRREAGGDLGGWQGAALGRWARKGQCWGRVERGGGDVQAARQHRARSLEGGSTVSQQHPQASAKGGPVQCLVSG